MQQDSEAYLIEAGDADAWIQILGRLPGGDVYFTPQYARCYDRIDGGHAMAFLFVSARRTFFFPFRKRAVRVKGFEDHFDVASEYGYGGPLASCKDAVFLRDAYAAWDSLARASKMVGEFCRYHPVEENHRIAEDHRPLEYRGDTVLCWLEADENGNPKGVSRNLIRDGKRSLRMGTRIRRLGSGDDLREFWRIYTASMTHAGAGDYYFFPMEFFEETLHFLGSRACVLMAELDGVALAGALFMWGDRCMHYHFSGTDWAHEKARAACGNTVILLEAMTMARQMGIGRFHLGGGVGAAGDSLFRFKSRFSPLRTSYHVSKHVFDQKLYAKICRRADADPNSDHFPAYRT